MDKNGHFGKKWVKLRSKVFVSSFMKVYKKGLFICGHVGKKWVKLRSKVFVSSFMKVYKKGLFICCVEK